MLLKTLLLLVLLAQTPHHRDTETWEQRVERLTLVAEAVDEASLRATCQGIYAPPEDDLASCKRLWPGSRKHLAFLLVTQALHESHLSAEVHANRCRLEKGECDARRVRTQEGVRYFQQAYSPWQLQRFADIPVGHWLEIQKGVEGTRFAAWHAARRLSSAYRACGSIQGAISRYAVGQGCQWAGAAERERTWKKLLNEPVGKLEAARDRHRERLLDKEQEPLEEPLEEPVEERVATRD